MTTIDDYVEARNNIQIQAENVNIAVANECWLRLGLANRHIHRVIYGELPLVPGVEDEIKRCLVETSMWLDKQLPKSVLFPDGQHRSE